VYTTIEVCDSKHPQCFSSIDSLNTSAWQNKDLEDHLSQSVLAAREEKNSGRLRLRQADAFVHMEVLTCMSKAGPIDSYRMAINAQQVLGGGAMRWSAEADVEDPEAEDLQQYFDSMSNLSEHKELIVSTQTNFSDAAIWRLGSGTRLMLDNIIMSDSRDESKYHEMLVHPALLVNDKPLNVLIIGGGEGATLREVLRNRHVQHVTMVDIDAGLVKICKKHLPMMHKGSFDSAKATVLFEDGVKFIQRAPSESYDVIIVDGIDVGDEDDPQNYGNVLFAEPFYMDVLRTLRRGGVLAQYMSGADKQDTMDTLYRVGFTDSQYLCVEIESFFGAGACFMLSSKSTTLRIRLESLETRLAEIAPEGGWSYLTPEDLRNCVGVQRRYLKSGRGSCNDRRPWHIITLLLPLALLVGY
jgi:spermidine synthase